MAAARVVCRTTCVATNWRPAVLFVLRMHDSMRPPAHARLRERVCACVREGARARERESGRLEGRGREGERVLAGERRRTCVCARARKHVCVCARARVRRCVCGEGDMVARVCAAVGRRGMAG